MERSIFIRLESGEFWRIFIGNNPLFISIKLLGCNIYGVDDWIRANRIIGGDLGYNDNSYKMRLILLYGIK